MRLNEVNTTTNKTAVFAFGRLNPPHFGHHAMINTLQKVAKEKGADWYLFVSSKTGDEKNPLTYEQKVWWIQTLFPETVGHLVIDSSIKTPLIAATWLYKKGYRSATFVAGEDDMTSYSEMIKSGNAHGIKNPDAVKQGKGYIFDPLEFAISPRLASATNARKNIQDNDPETFVRSILGHKINPKLAELVHDKLFPTLRKAMGLSESIEEARRKTSWEKMATPFKGTSKDLDKKAERSREDINSLKQLNKDYQAIVDKDKKQNESKLLNKHTPSVSQLAKKYMTSTADIHKQLANGIKVEFEHTSDIDVATEIAMDHLGEKLDYYTRLAKVEEELPPNSKNTGPPAPNTTSTKIENESEDDDAVAVPGEPVSAAMSRMNARPTDQSKADFLGSYMKSALGQGGFTDGRFSQHTNDLKKKIGENFADGKGPGRPGDSQRHGIPKKASIEQLEKASHAEGRKGQLARWQLNMRRGKKHAKEDGPFAFGSNPDTSNLLDRQVAIMPWDIKTPHPKEIDEVADLKKEIDSKFYDLSESDQIWSPMELAIMEGGHLLDESNEFTDARMNAIKAGKDTFVVHGKTYKVTGDTTDEREASLEETLKKVKGKWALVSRQNPKKVLQYYHGSQHPSKEWVNKVERRVHSFESIMEDDAKPRVYLDMDGVLADFFGEWSRISGVDHYKDINDVEAKLQLVRDHPTFWIDLPMLPHAKALIKTVISQFGEYRICSKPLEGDTRSKQGKLSWIHKHLSDMPPAEVILTADKAEYATNNGFPNVLVDDFGKNINAWRAAGGIGIKYEDTSFNTVSSLLIKIAKSGVSK
jgi:5'(3')-deoxyribonucleotidase